MKRTLSLVLSMCLILSCAALLSACGDKGDKNFPVTINDTQIDAAPKKVVVLNDACADVILYMGYDVKLAGRSVECDQQMLSILPSVGSSSNPAVDTLLGLEPDLVIAEETLSTKARNKLDEEGVTVLTLTPASTQEQIKELYITLGTALGGKVDGAKKGEDAYEKLFNLLDEYSTTTSNIVVTDAYLYLDDQGNYCTFTQGSVQAKIFGYNGAMNVFSSKISPEFRRTDADENISAADSVMSIRYASPTFLFLDGAMSKDGTIQSAVYDKLLSDDILSGLSALKQDRIFFIPLKNFYRPGVTFEETLFTMIDALNKDEDAAEEASLNPSEEATEAPTEAPTAAPTKPAAAAAPTEVEEVVEDDEIIYYDDDNDVYADEEVYY